MCFVLCCVVSVLVKALYRIKIWLCYVRMVVVLYDLLLASLRLQSCLFWLLKLAVLYFYSFDGSQSLGFFPIWFFRFRSDFILIPGLFTVGGSFFARLLLSFLPYFDTILLPLSKNLFIYIFLFCNFFHRLNLEIMNLI